MSHRPTDSERLESITRLIDQWSSIVASVSTGYQLTLDDYLNDLDLRRAIDEKTHSVRYHSADIIPEELTARLADADARFRIATRESAENIWGAENEAENGWSRDRQWWYYRLPERIPDWW
jgi:hypothetical protein